MKAKTQMDLNLARGIKHNKGFCKHIGDRRKSMENVGPLLNHVRDLVPQEGTRLRY